jgi:hypothetical protein
MCFNESACDCRMFEPTIPIERRSEYVGAHHARSFHTSSTGYKRLLVRSGFTCATIRARFGLFCFWLALIGMNSVFLQALK